MNKILLRLQYTPAIYFNFRQFLTFVCKHRFYKTDCFPSSYTGHSKSQSNLFNVLFCRYSLALFSLSSYSSWRLHKHFSLVLSASFKWFMNWTSFFPIRQIQKLKNLSNWMLHKHYEEEELEMKFDIYKSWF